MPVLLIGGDRDAIVTMETVIPRMQKLVLQLKVICIPDMGHALINLSGQIIPFLTA